MGVVNCDCEKWDAAWNWIEFSSVRFIKKRTETAKVQAVEAFRYGRTEREVGKADKQMTGKMYIETLFLSSPFPHSIGCQFGKVDYFGAKVIGKNKKTGKVDAVIAVEIVLVVIPYFSVHLAKVIYKKKEVIKTHGGVLAVEPAEDFVAVGIGGREGVVKSLGRARQVGRRSQNDVGRRFVARRQSGRCPPVPDRRVRPWRRR